MKKAQIKLSLPQAALDEHKKMVASLLDDERIIAFKKHYHVDDEFIKNHAARFKMWLENVRLCDNCQGLFTCKQDDDGYVMQLVVEQGVLVSEMQKCKFLLEKEAAHAHLKQFLINDVGEHHYLLRLDHFELDHEHLEYLEVFDFVKTWLDKRPFKTMYLYGSPGSGKTYLMSALANELALKGTKVAFVHVPSFVSTAKQYFDNLDGMRHLIDATMVADVLIMDDIGAENITAWSRDELLFPILNHRLESKKSTFFTSNETLETLQAQYAVDQKGRRSNTKAIRFVERIKASATPFELVGENRRHL